MTALNTASRISGLRNLAHQILEQCSYMEDECQKKEIPQPSLESGNDTQFWSPEISSELHFARERTLGYLQSLTTLVQGPHDFLHELVAPNWDHGAFYVFLQSNVPKLLASAPRGRATLSDLAVGSGIPEDKLLRILGLLRCRSIVDEPERNVFALNAVTEEIVKEEDFAQWLEFQLFETRIASANLSDALKSKPNDYAQGTTGFKQGLGAEMYEWHARHPEKGERFRRAMKGVSQSLDPADSLIRKWVDSNSIPSGAKIVELGGRYGFASSSLVEDKPQFSFEVRCDNPEFIRRGEALVTTKSKDRIKFQEVSSLSCSVPPEDGSNVSVYLIRNLLWNYSDDDTVKLLQALFPTLRATPTARVVITDGVSPLSGDFPPHIEIGYRRRDITTMTMHNAKQRNQEEWLQLFGRVDPATRVTSVFEKSSHVYKGLWELQLQCTL